MKHILTAVFLILFWMVGYADVTLQVESPTVEYGQPFRLTLTIEDAQTNAIPDLTPLRKDFTIVGTERSVNYALINGQSRTLSQWTVLLLPKREGKFTIPPIRVGQEETVSTTIEVMKDAAGMTDTINAREQKSVMLQTEVSTSKPYVNQQVLYTVKLYNNRRLFDADYQPPRIEDGLLIPLGDGRRYQVMVNGTAYTVDELQYAVFPQKSGPLKITPPRFQALLSGTIPQRITVAAETTTLDVKPVPAKYLNQIWLPAKQVTVTETFDRSDNEFQQGDMLVRTITVRATGMVAQLMPALKLATSDQYSIYPEKPVEKTSFVQGDLIGTTTMKVTYLLNKAGKIVIPEVKLPWFNTLSGQSDVATLAKKTIEVIPAAGVKSAANSGSGMSPAQNATPLPAPVNANQPAAIPSSSGAFVANDNKAWWVAGIFALAWIVTLLLWWWRQSPHNRGRLTKARKKLREACLANQPEQAKDALIEWAHCQWPDAGVLNLADIGRQVRDPVFKKHLNALAQALYHADQTRWRGDELWRCIVNNKLGKAAGKNKSNPLPPIHPSVD
ncbi:BatD family protein [Legionella spiritensis]|uniref:BatD family protein n=1 Tax=Legionella spiritensis TaxID=452 RepID=UPI000F6B9582|nr:BatD family protein [Legionella spiritensis]VEG91470.1 KQDN repeat-containing protein [Legionella spiritensis]